MVRRLPGTKPMFKPVINTGLDNGATLTWRQADVETSGDAYICNYAMQI